MSKFALLQRESKTPNIAVERDGHHLYVRWNKDMTRLKLTLEENAASFAEEALGNAVVANENPTRWKFAILALVQAIELSLKEILRREHPALINTNVDNPGKTVGIELATYRLKNICEIEVSKDDSKAIKAAVMARNNIVHHHIDESVDELRLLFSRLLGFLNEFHDKHIDRPLHDKIDDQLWRQGAKIKDYGEELFRRAQSQMENDGISDECLTTCPMCGWNALCAFEPKQDTCYVCGWTEKVVICSRCNELMLVGEHEEFGGKDYCHNCLSYITDDYWYEQSVGK